MADNESSGSGSGEDEQDSIRFDINDWYYVNEEDKQIGPIGHIQLKKDWDTKEFTDNCEVWCPGMPEWLDVKDFPDLKNFLNTITNDSIEIIEITDTTNDETKLITFPCDSPIGIWYSGNRIVDVAPNSKANEFGVCVGWRILEVDGNKQPNLLKVVQESIRQCKEKGQDIKILFSTSATEDQPIKMLLDVQCRISKLLINCEDLKVTLSLDPTNTVNEILEAAIQTLKSKKLLEDPTKVRVEMFGLKQPMQNLFLPGESILKDIASSARPVFWLTEVNQAKPNSKLDLSIKLAQTPIKSSDFKHEFTMAMPDETTLDVLFEKFITSKGFTEPFASNIQKLKNESKWHMLCGNLRSPLQTTSIKEGFLMKSPLINKWKNKDPNQMTKYWFLLYSNRLDFRKDMKSMKNKVAGSIILDNSTQILADQSLGIKNAFVIIKLNPKKPKEISAHFCLQASSVSERDSWLVTLRDIISCIPKRKKKAKNKEIDKSHHQFELAEDMMLGIRTSIGKLGGIPASERLSKEDMQSMIRHEYPSAGSKSTPPHSRRSFYFKDYAPKVFRRIRARFGIDPSDYMIDVCGNAQYLEFLSNSKSGQFFFYTHKRKYMIKTVSHNECRTLMNMLPEYYRHLMSNTNTLLTPFFGMHKVSVGHTTYWFLIMGSVFPTTLKMNRMYDLKGSTRHREVKPHEKGKDGTVFKDNDFVEQNMCIHVGPEVAKELKAQLERDVKLLAKHKIIDYSVLLGVHYLTVQEKDLLSQHSLTAEQLEILKKSVKKSVKDSSKRYSNLEITLDKKGTKKYISSPGRPISPKSPNRAKFKRGSNTFGVSGDQNIKAWKDSALRLSEDLQEVLSKDIDDLKKLSQNDFTKLTNGNVLAQDLFERLELARNLRKRTSVATSPRRSIITVANPLGQPYLSSQRSVTIAEDASVDLTQESCFKMEKGGVMGKDGNTIFFIGIIDTLIEYGIGKKSENMFKTKMKNLDAETISVVKPDHYMNRFLSFMKKYIE